MNKKEYILELQNQLIELSIKIINKVYPINKYENQQREFAPFNENFKKIIQKIPDSFYLNEESDKEILEEIIGLIEKIKSKIETL